MTCRSASTFSSSGSGPRTAIWTSSFIPKIRRFARGEAQPRCYAAETFGGQTNWIQKADLRAANVIWLQARVDTSEAGFVHPPFYFARLSSPSASAFPSGPPALFILDYSASHFHGGLCPLTAGPGSRDHQHQ